MKTHNPETLMTPLPRAVPDVNATAVSCGAQSSHNMRCLVRLRIPLLLTAAALALFSQAPALGDTVPAITQQPANQTTSIGSNFSLSVTATGSSQLSYQWFVNGVPLYGVQNSQYTRSGAQPADAGLYTVSVTDAAGSTTSTAATVTVSPDTIPISFPPVDFG